MIKNILEALLMLIFFIAVTSMVYSFMALCYELYTSVFGHAYYATFQVEQGSIVVSFVKKGLGNVTTAEVKALMDYIPKKYKSGPAMLTNLIKLETVYTLNRSDDITWVLYGTKERTLFYTANLFGLIKNFMRKRKHKKKTKKSETQIKPEYKGPRLLRE